MSINEVIKKYLPMKSQKLAYANKHYNYCAFYSYQNCEECHKVKRIRCCKKLTYHTAKQINDQLWHLYFLCSEQHIATRWVRINDNSVLVGKIKN